MFNLGRAYIKENCSDFSFDRGLEYHFGNRVRAIQFNPQKRVFTAVVHDHKERQISVSFDTDGTLVNSQCSCRLPSKASSYFCEHIVAVLMLIEQRDGEGFFAQLKDREKARRIFEMFSYPDTSSQDDGAAFREQVQLEAVYALPVAPIAAKTTLGAFLEGEPLFESFYKTIHERNAKVLFRIKTGASSYMIKNIGRFASALDKKQPLDFSKKFTFDPSRYFFKGFDAQIAGFLLEMLEVSEGGFKSGAIAGMSNTDIFKDRYLCLTDRQFRRFLDVFASNKRPIPIFRGASIDSAPILDERVPISFRLERDGGDFILKADTGEDLLPLTTDFDIIYKQGAIYRLPVEQSTILRPFLNLLENYHESDFRFISEDRGRFVSEVLPAIDAIGALTIDDEVSLLIEKKPLEIEVYLDREDNAVTADVRFRYGETDINPFSAAPKPKAGKETNGAKKTKEAKENKDNKENNDTNEAKKSEKNDSESRIIVRDVARENEILDILAEADFKVKNGKINLYDDESIFNLVIDILPKLQKSADVYYSQEFRRMTVKRSIGFRANLSLRDSGGGLAELLAFSFDTDHIDRDELIEILRGIREKKRYYKLRDGSLLNIQDQETMDVMRLLDLLGAGNDDIIDGKVMLPRYRALFLDSFLRDTELRNIGRDKILREFISALSEPSDNEYSPPICVGHVLRDYQRTGFKWLKALSAYSLGGILADDMGLGKTLQVLVLLLSAKESANNVEPSQPSLIIAPTSLIYNWCAEIDKFTPELNYIAIYGGKADRAKLISSIPGFDVAITSYPLIRRDYEDYKNISFEYIILDEAQYIKNPQSQNAMSVKCLRARSRIALTGTPIENRLLDLWSIFDFVLPGYLKSSSEFCDRYADEAPANGGGAAGGADNSDNAGGADSTAATAAGPARAPRNDALGELSRLIKPFILRRLKTDVLRELPDKIDTRMYARMTDEQKKIYLAYHEKIRMQIESEIKENGFEKSRFAILAALTRLRQICCHPALFVEGYTDDSGKFDLLQEIIQEAIGGGHRILLFSQFTEMLAIIRAWVESEGIGYHYLDGNVKANDRHHMIGEFNGGAKDIFLLSLKAGGTGINLTGADTVIHYDPWWNPAVEDQATDRAYRIGQHKTVQVIKLITAGSIEEKIAAMQERKKQLIDAVIQPGETFLTKLSKADIDELLSL